MLPLTLLSHYRQDIQGNRTVEHGPEIFRKFHGPILPILLRIWTEGIHLPSPIYRSVATFIPVPPFSPL